MDHGAVEREIKLEAGIGFRIPDLDGLSPGVIARSEADLHLQAVYVDTPDLRLLRSGLTLRHRSERSQPRESGEWTLKLPEPSSEAGLSRREINWPGRWGPVPSEIAGLVRAYRRDAVLGPLARLVTHRRRAVLSGRLGERLLEIDDDVVSVMDGRRLAARFREVEVEVVGPAPAFLLEAVVARLEEAGAVRGEPKPKLVRAIGFRATEPPDVVPVPIGRGAPIGEVVRAAIAQGYLRLLAHDLGVRLDEDPEDVHQARVATRRLRSDLRTFRDFLPEKWANEIRAELGWVAEALGRARDADVLFERLQGEIEFLDGRDAGPAAALISKLVAQRGEAHEHLMEVFDSDRYSALLDRLVLAARELPPLKVADSPGPNGVVGAPGISRAPVVPEAPAVPGVSAAPAVPGVPAASAAPAVPAGSAVPAAFAAPVIAAVPAASAVSGLPSESSQQAVLPSAAAGLADPDGAGPGLPDPEPSLPALGPERDAPAKELAPSVVTGPWRHLARAVSALGPDPSDELLHQIRIRAKRLRYACEAVAPVVGKPAAELARAAADLQGVLGDFHDAVVAEEWLRTASAGASSTQAVAAGQLIARQRQDAARTRAEWRQAWKRLNHKKLRAWLN